MTELKLAVKSPKVSIDGIYDEKVFKTAANLIGDDLAEETLKKSPEELRELISNCAITIKNATDEMKANEEYKAASETCKLFRAGLTAATKPYKARNALAVFVLSHIQTQEENSKSW